MIGGPANLGQKVRIVRSGDTRGNVIRFFSRDKGVVDSAATRSGVVGVVEPEAEGLGEVVP